MYRVLCIIGILLVSASSYPAAAANRVALVIGNSNYAQVPFLPNAVQDARDVAGALRQLGFEVHDGYDLTRAETLRLAADVTGKLGSDDVALFYFSGHGIQIGAENFIIPVDAAGDGADALKQTSVSLQSILREMELRADRNIIILDACRNNPFQARMVSRAVGGVARGLARVDAGVGSYIAFSTQPGNVALDGSGNNSPFTEALLKHLGSGGDDLHELMRKVRADVVDATGGQQVPWENSSMIEQVFLSRPAGRAAVPLNRKDSGSVVASAPPASSSPASAPRMEAVSTPPPQHQQQPQFTHVVAGLDPNGDGFLALREGYTSGARRISTMREGSRLAVLGQEGVWFNVRTETGLVGWAHSNWIRFVGAAQATQPPPAAAPATKSCDQLWYERNAYFARYGYCFQSARGQAAFPPGNCRPGVTVANAPLTGFERSEVARLEAEEKRLGCR